MIVKMKIRFASYDEIEEELNRIKTEVAYLRENEIESYLQLFRPFLLGVGIQILQQLTGMNSLIYYAPEIFKRTLGNYSKVRSIFSLTTLINFDRKTRNL